jgi:zinc protease
LSQFIVAAALYPPGHPYHWPTIGDPDDLRRATLEDVHAFFRRYYHPGNASLAIAGDVDTARVLDEVGDLFGDIPAGPAVEPVRAPGPNEAGSRLVHEDRVELARLYLAWPSPPLFGPGDAALDLASDILANGRSSRLYRRLIHDHRVATELAAYQASRELSGMFQIMATAAPGHTLAEIAAVIEEEIGRLADEGPTAEELARGRVQAEAAFVHRLETLGGFGGRADQLNAYNTYLGRPDGFDEDLRRYLEVEAEQLAQACRTWLAAPPRVSLGVVPEGQVAVGLRDAVPAVMGAR